MNRLLLAIVPSALEISIMTNKIVLKIGEEKAKTYFTWKEEENNANK